MDGGFGVGTPKPLEKRADSSKAYVQAYIFKISWWWGGGVHDHKKLYIKMHIYKIYLQIVYFR